MITTYPKITAVKPLEQYKILVTFANQIVKVYDCTFLFREASFPLLRDKAVFQAVQVDKGGYGIFWSDDLDVSEAELWIHGEIVDRSEQPAVPTGPIQSFQELSVT